ncbi:MAG: CoA-binding protein [Actinomycetota bacterium]
MTYDFAQIDGIINARSLAIVGASNAPMKFGSLFTRSQVSMGFEGDLYLVNPNEQEIMGRQAYPDIPSLPGPVDLVYLTIPAHRSMQVLRDCAGRGVKGVIVMASGFREIGPEGKALEEEALALAREGGFRLIGPNCFGIYNPRNGLTLLPGHDFSREVGGTAFISQSGGFSAHVARLGRSLGIDFSAVVSYGNAADLDESELLEYFADDPQTRLISGYLEGIKDGKAFRDALSRAAAVKPVVLWKVGQAESSRRAVLSHTGSLAGSGEVWDALMKQCGVVSVSGVEELCDVFLAFEHLGRTSGRLLVSGGGGGLGTYGADLAEAAGLEVPALSAGSMARLQEILNRAGAVAGNPLDIGAPLIPMEIFESAMMEAGRDPATDVLVFDLAVNFGYDLAGEDGVREAARILAHVKDETGKNVVAVLYSRSNDAGNLYFEGLIRDLTQGLREAGVAVYPSMSRAITALAKLR